jgi:aryl-alcohol dehydrogenase-like predicted oxidoreductase
MDRGLPKRTLGLTGLEVTQLGFGTAYSGEVDDEQAERVLNSVLDAGINFIDTAPDYEGSEERIGRYISHRRDEFFLATKCGCNIAPNGEGLDPGHLWTADRLRRNIDQSLSRMKTDHVDILQMHNPSVEEVERGELLQVLEEIRRAGKTRLIGISSTAPDLLTFAETRAFDTFQVPYSALERRHEQMLHKVTEYGAGVIIRGGVAQGRRGSDERWAKWDRARLDEIAEGVNRYEFVLRFTLTHPACHTAIVGTSNLDHLRVNIAAAKAGPLSSGVYSEARERMAQIGEKPDE